MKPREAEGEIDQIPVIYSVESETDEDYQMGSKIKLVDNADDSYEINLTSVKVNKGEVRRRVRTEFTRQEVNKLFEFKKNNIQLQKGRELEATEANNQHDGQRPFAINKQELRVRRKKADVPVQPRQIQTVQRLEAGRGPFAQTIDKHLDR